MLYAFRFVIAVIYSILVYIFGSTYCLSSPRNPKRVATFGRMLDRLASLFGLKVECREPADTENYGNAIYIANHQNNYDMVTVSNIVQPPMATVDKKSLLWILLFRQLCWLTGNLLIDRNNHTRAHSTTTEVVNHFKKRRTSIWMFPEGTRSRGHGLLPFKTEAFYAAITVGVPIVPVCVSVTSSRIDLSRLHNGLVTAEMLPPINASQYGKDQVRELAAHCRSIMEQRIAELGKEVTGRETAGKVQVDNLCFCGEHPPAQYYFSQSYMG